MRRCVWPRLNDCWEKNYETDKRDGGRCIRCGGGGYGSWLLVGGGGGQRTEDSICCATRTRPQDSVLPQSDGFAGYLTDTQKKLDGHGLFSGVRRRGGTGRKRFALRCLRSLRAG